MKLVTFALMALALSACASTATTGSGTAQPVLQEKEYRTGSRIPVRDNASASPSKSLDPSALSTGAPPRVN